MCARERAFLRGTRRLTEGGRRRHVDESRAAGKPSHLAGLEIWRKREEQKRALWRRRRGRADPLHGTLACFRLSLYISLPTYTCLRVSPRCSGLNILLVRRALLSRPSFLVHHSFLAFFFLRIVAGTVRELTRNPLVASTHHTANDGRFKLEHSPACTLRFFGTLLGAGWNLLRKITSLRLRRTIRGTGAYFTWINRFLDPFWYCDFISARLLFDAI